MCLQPGTKLRFLCFAETRRLGSFEVRVALGPPFPLLFPVGLLSCKLLVSVFISIDPAPTPSALSHGIKEFESSEGFEV